MVKKMLLHNPLNRLAGEILEINRANGWEQVLPRDWASDFVIPTKLSLIHSEVSEALEAFRADDRANFEEELADTLIRVLDTAAGLGIDMDKVVAAKLAKNRTRGHKHGGKRV